MPRYGAYTTPVIASAGSTAANAVWYSWNSSTSSTASTTYSMTTDGHIWSAWNNDIGTTGTIVLTGNNAVWTQWYGQQANYYARMGYQQQAYQGRNETQEERAARFARAEQERVAREIRRAEDDARWRAENARIAKAKDRAERTLHQFLSEKQSEELKANGHFHLEVISSSGERKRYRINRGRHGNIDQVDDSGRRIKRLCVHPTPNVPDADTMLAQKLFLESAEEDILRVANIS